MNKDVSKETALFIALLRGFLCAEEATRVLPSEVREGLYRLLEKVRSLGLSTEKAAVALGSDAPTAEVGYEPGLTRAEWERLAQNAPLLGRFAEWVVRTGGRTVHVPRPEIGEAKITFTHTSVTVNGEDVNKDASWLLAEYLILKKGRVYWPWACVILPTFEVEDPDRAFRNYLSKKRRTFDGYGIHFATHKKKAEDGALVFEGMDDKIVSNIKNVKLMHDKARKEYEAGDRARAVSMLSHITEDDQNDWYIFTAAYMDLAKWICEAHFKDVTERLIEKCTSFLTWYSNKLRLGILKAAHYVQMKTPGGESLHAFEDVKMELRHAEELHRALTERLPLSKDDKAYEDTVALILDYREKYISISGEAERELERDTVVEVIQSYCEQNGVLATIIADSRDELDDLTEAKHQRDKWNARHIEDLHKELYWFLHEAIVGMENLDEFHQAKDNKLIRLKNYLSSYLSKELKSCV